MAVITIETWQCDFQNYSILFDDVSKSVYYQGPSVIELDSQCWSIRGKTLGETIFSYCDNGVEKLVKATFANPFFYIENGSLTSCLNCDLVISSQTKTNPTTLGGNDGSIGFTATSTGANLRRELYRKNTSNFFVSIGGEVAISSGVPVIISNLIEGEYRVIVREDLTSCTDQLNTYNLIDEPGCEVSFQSAVTTDETAPDTDDGTAVISAFGPNPLEYSLTDLVGSYQSSSTFNNLSPGNYTVYIREIATPSCKATGTFSILSSAGVLTVSRISEVKQIKVRHECYDHPIYLVWLNSLGGWDQWLFTYDHKNTTNTKGGKDFERPIGEISTQEIIRETIGKTSRRSIRVGADNLETQEIIAISEIIDSRQVYWMRVVNGTPKKLGVKVLTTSVEYNERNSRHPIRLEIELPDKFLIQ